MDWKVGDIAICTTPGSRMQNMEVMIVSPPYSVFGKPDLVHQVDPGMPPGGIYECWGAERRHLKPLPDPNTPCRWEDCVFTPNRDFVIF